jgi:hypothetical protein
MQISQIGSVQPDFIVLGRSGEPLHVVEVKVPKPVDYAAKARRRIAQLKSAPSPWDDSPSMSAELEPTVFVSPEAEAAAVAIFTQFALQPPPSTVAIFPKEDGGLSLQTFGEERTVLVDISAAGHEFVCEYAGDNVFHTQTMWSAVDAWRFILDSTR